MAFYYKTCDACGSHIRMAQVAGGRYRPFEPRYNQGRHSCRSGQFVVRALAVESLAEPLTRLPAESGCNVQLYDVSGFDIVGRFILLIRIAAVLIVAALWLFFDYAVPQLLRWLGG